MSTPSLADAARREILRKRAHALAAVPGTAQAADQLEVVEFSLSGERYAVPAADVTEALPFSHWTPLPCTPAFVVGLVNVRGRILHVIDLRAFFELPARGIMDLHHILVVRSGRIELGLLADLITGLRRVPLHHLQPSLPTLTGIRADFLRGVTADRLAVLDVARLLSDPRQVVQEEVPL